MSTTQTNDLPPKYEQIEHHDELSVHDPNRGIIITTTKRDPVRCHMTDEYPYKVTAAQDQQTTYEGTFDSQTHAEQKVIELAHEL